MNSTLSKALVLGAVFAALACGRSSTSSNDEHTQTTNVPQAGHCIPEKQAQCDDLVARIEKLQKDRDAAISKNDRAATEALTLDLNYSSELLELLRQRETNPDAFAQLERKYASIRQLIATQPRTVAPTDNLNPHPLSPLVYDPRELEAAKKVFAEYGDLYIAPSALDTKCNPISEELQVKMPWSGYWYPLHSDELFGGDKAPLSKLDQVSAKMNRPIASAKWESDRSKLFYNDSWEGHCAAWATAAVMSQEPTKPVVYQGVTFEIKDQKALLTKAYETYPFKLYGIRYNGDAATDGTAQDIRPEAFHRLILSVLGEQKRALIVDDDPGVEVWNKPIYRMSWTIKQDPQNANAYLVKAWPWMTRQRPMETAEPTSINDRAAPAYEYRLYVDPKTVKDGKQKVIAGEWINGSVANHPDTVTLPEVQGSMGSANTEVNKNIDIVKEILKAGGAIE